ncbi:MAG: DMT family transporter [Gammaproteobacteria bacterium]|nr:DMT family transporter [Gammaproteobacteria bacterium]
MIGIGEIFALSSALVWAIAVIMFTKIGSRLPAFELNLVKNTIGFVLLALTSLLFEGLQWPSLTLHEWTVLIISGLIGIAIADTLYMKALNTIGAGSTGIIAALYSPSVVFLSLIYLGESLSYWQWLGMLIVLSGIILISLDKPQRVLETSHPFKGILYAATSVFLTALGVVMIKPIVEQQPFFFVTGARLLIGVLGMLVYLMLQRRLITTFNALIKVEKWPQIILSSILGAYIAMTLWLAGYKFTDASIAAILNETNFIFIVVFAWLFLKESISVKKIMGSALTLTGVVVVLLL